MCVLLLTFYFFCFVVCRVSWLTQSDAELYKGIINALMPDVFQKLTEAVVPSKIQGTVTAVETGYIMLGDQKVELKSEDHPELTVYASVRKDDEIKVGDKIGEVSLKKDIRNFGKKYDSWLAKAMEGCAPAFVRTSPPWF